MISAIRPTALALALALSPCAAGAQELLEQYVAYIGPHDLYNSKGARLWEPWQILRQDRANFHRFGLRDGPDQGDRFFGSVDNRAAMERMVMRGRIEPTAAQNVVNGGATVVVKVWGQGGRGESVTVNVYR